jgi:two-component system phosphate regulon sensor histidine kinase PhoR
VERDLRLWVPHERLVRATATPLAGDERAVLLVLRDQSEAERLDRVRRDFVANVSHEVKTPLTSVRGYAETLLEGGLEDPEHREGFVRVIRDQATRLQELVDDLLSLSELERPEARLRVERFDLRVLAERQLAALADRAAHTGLTLELAPGQAEWIEADRARIEQVVANLLDNALKYTERGGVTVMLEGDPSTVSCTVQDTGPGIPAEDLDRIFERFYRVDKARSREKGGTGLGLSIVKHIVALHEGQVSVDSAPGRGSVFRFVIPRVARARSG